MDADRVQQSLTKLRTYEQAQYLFGDLGYSDAGDDPVSTRYWPERVRDTAIAPRYLAERGGFKIIYCELNDERIRRVSQRPIIEEIVRDHPHCLSVFRTQPQNLDQVVWEFVNVRVVSRESDQRISQQIHRIQVGPSERIQNRLRTASERLAKLDINGQRSIAPIDIQSIHDQAFDVEQVTRDFYNRYVQIFDALASDVESRNPFSHQEAEAQARLLLDRLMFLYFIQKKGWLDGRNDYLYGRFATGYTLAMNDVSYYHNVITPLFVALAAPDRGGGEVGDVPFLNGGLFQLDNIALTLNVSNGMFKKAFDQLFERYAFTIEEDTPNEKAVAIDPEMLGKVFENLVLTRDQEKDERKSTGSYYTPRSIVRFMCQQSLSAYVVQAWRTEFIPNSPDGMLPIKLVGKGGQTALRDLELDQQTREYTERILKFIEGGEASGLGFEEARRLRSRLANVRVIDPAVGSGAFLVGMLQELLRLIRLLDEYTGDYNVAIPNYDYERKRDLIERCLFGVDIQEQAVRICELRLWLSLVVDFEPSGEYATLREWLDDVRPLPNLSYRVRCGNSLIEQVLGERIQLDALGVSNLTHATVAEIRDKKLTYFSMTELDEKRRTQAMILALKARLTRDFLNYRAVRINEKISRQQNLPGFEHPSRQQRIEREQQIVERDRLLALVDRADAIRHDAEVLRASDKDQYQLAKLEAELGSFIWRVDFGEVFADRGGFDIAIGNPPYVRQERIKAQKPDFETLFPEVYTGTADLYVYFYAQALNLLHMGGVLAFISPNKFLRAGYGEKLRTHLGSQTTFDALLDFGDLPVFDATTYPLIAITYKQEAAPDSSLRAVNVTHMDQLPTLAQSVRAQDATKQFALRRLADC